MKNITCFIIRILIFFLPFDISAQVAHQGKLYLDEDTRTSGIFTQTEKNEIEQWLTDAKESNLFINVMIYSSDCDLSKVNDTYIGPEVDGNCVWWDNSIHWWLVLEPGNWRITGYGDFKDRISQLYDDFGNGNENRPYSNKIKCAISILMDEVNQVFPYAPDPTFSFLDVCEQYNPISIGKLFSLDEHPYKNIELDIIKLKRIESNYCTKIKFNIPYYIRGSYEISQGESDKMDELFGSNYLRIDIVPFEDSSVFEDVKVIPITNGNYADCFPQFVNLSSNDFAKIETVIKTAGLSVNNTAYFLNKGIDFLEQLLQANKGITPFQTDCETCDNQPLWTPSVFTDCIPLPPHMRSLFQPNLDKKGGGNATSDIIDQLGLPDVWRQKILDAVNRGNTRWNFKSQFAFSFHTSRYNGLPDNPVSTFPTVYQYFGGPAPGPKPAADITKGSRVLGEPGHRIWFHYNADANELCYKVIIDFLDAAPGLEKPKFEQSHIEALESFLINDPSGDLFRDSDFPHSSGAGSNANHSPTLQPSDWYFGVRTNKEINFFSGINELGGLCKGFILTQEFDEAVWKPNGDCLFDIPSPLVGIAEGGISLATENSVPGMIWSFGSLVYQCASDDETRQGMKELAKNPTLILAGVFNDIQTILDPDEPNEVRYYAGTKFVFNLFDLFKGKFQTPAGPDRGQILGAIDDGPVGSLASLNHYGKKLPEDPNHLFHVNLRKLSKEDRELLLSEFEQVDIEKMVDKPGMVDAWKGLFNTGIRTDITWLTRASKWIDEGGNFVQSGGKTWFRKNGDDIFEIKNAKILPNKKSNYYRGSDGIPVGDPVNGYQVVKIGDEIKVKRVPDKTPYLYTTYETKLTGPNTHVLERHGHDVTDDALIKRASEGIAPDGTILGSPIAPIKPFSSKFDDSDKLKLAYDKTNPSSSAWSTRTKNQYGDWDVIYNDPNVIFGKGIEPPGTGSFETLTKVKASYTEVSPGIFQLITMYPIK